MTLFHDFRIYGLFTYAKDDWAQKAKTYFWPADVTSKYTVHGLKYESFAREKYIQQEAVNVWEFGLIAARTEPWLAYSPDGIVKSTESIKLLEIKCPYELNDTDTETLFVKCKRFLIEEDGVLQLKKNTSITGKYNVVWLY